MMNIGTNLRKAAVLLRSLDADTAAMMLAQLSTEEAAAIRRVMFTLGPLDTDEQDDVAAELRLGRSAKKRSNSGDVELSLSSLAHDETGQRSSTQPLSVRSNRFDFLDSAPISALVPYLAREHAQTVAVVLSHLAPRRAASVLSALPQKLQAEAVERLSTLGETDAESMSVLERELEAWVAKREGMRTGATRRDTMTAILAAADATTRGQILSNLKNHHVALANQTAPMQPSQSRSRREPVSTDHRTSAAAKRTPARQDAPLKNPARRAVAPAVPPIPLIRFDDLIHLDGQTLASVLRQADANLLALALVGSREEMVDRICDQMPKRTARAFRRELRRLGPTRLSDVEAAQHAVAQIAARQLAGRQFAASGADL